MDRRTFASLQRSAGNRAATTLAATVQRRDPDSDPPEAVDDVPEKIEKAYRSKDPGDVKAIGNDNLHRASEEYRWDFIHTLAYQGWAGIRDEWALEKLWESFGDKVLDAARKHPDYFKQSMDKGADLHKLANIKNIPPKFIDDVRAVTGGFLKTNDDFARNELASLGSPVEGQAAADPDETKARMEGLQNSAKVVTVAREAQQELTKIVVGYDVAHDEDSTELPPEEGRKMVDQGIAVPFGYKHGTKPLIPNTTGPTYDEVEAQWLLLEQIIAGQGAKNPSIYAVMQHGGKDDINTLATDSPEKSRGMVVGSLTRLRDNIKTTKDKLPGNLAYELNPIHGQLLSGKAKGPSNIDWSEPTAHALGENVLTRHSDQEFLVTLGLTSIGAAMFLLAEIASLGTATVLLAAGTGISAGMTAASWEKAYTLSKTEGTSLNKETELVAKGQASEATVEAVLNTVMLFLDAYGAGKSLVGKMAAVTTAETAGAARAVVLGLDRLSIMKPLEAILAVENGIVREGVDAVLKKSGKTVEELQKIVGPKSPVAGRLQAFLAAPAELKVLTDTELAQKLATLPAIKDPKLAQGLVALSIEKLGPKNTLKRAGGWAKLVNAAGRESAGMVAMRAWRDAAIVDTIAFIETAEKSVISAAGGADKAAAEFLGGRLGGSADELGIGTAKALIEGTGEREFADLMLKATDRRTLAGRGLLGADQMKAFAEESLTLKDTWKTLTPEARFQTVFDLVNKRLEAINVPKLRSYAACTDADGYFIRSNWQLQLRLATSEGEKPMAEVLEAAYHEARHAEQAFNAGRLKVGEGWDAERLMKATRDGGFGMDETTAREAVKQGAIKADSAEGRAASSFFESMAGAGRSGRKVVLDDMDAALKAYEDAAAAAKKFKDSKYLAGPSLARRDKLYDEYLRKYAAYKGLPEEADAWKVSDKVGQVIAEHDRQLAMEAAQEAKLTDPGPSTARPGKLANE